MKTVSQILNFSPLGVSVAVWLVLGWMSEPAVGAPQIWTGPTFTFTESAAATGTQPADQDRITPQVWLTRAPTRGLFNVVSESSFTSGFSPAGTEWAFGQLTNYASLTYTDWEDWTGKNPPISVGQDAVLHLIAENIYLSVRFTSWPAHGAGGFSYLRSTPPQSLFQAVTNASGQIAFTVAAPAGQVCQLQFTTNLITSNWMNLGGAITATNGAVIFTDAAPFSTAPQRFYRVRSP